MAGSSPAMTTSPVAREFTPPTAEAAEVENYLKTLMELIGNPKASRQFLANRR